MSLPQNIYPLPIKPVQNRLKGLQRESANIRSRLSALLEGGRYSLTGFARKSGVSPGYLSMFLKGYEVSPRILYKLKKALGQSGIPRNRKDKRIFPCPGYWVKDAI